jgi:hypothetical protein
LAAGCGSDSGSSDTEADLAAALPGDPMFVSYMDFDAAKEALGLPDDADPVDFDALGSLDDPTPEGELVDAARSALPHASEAFSVRFEADSTTAAIDHTQVSAAAASIDTRVAVLESDQPFDAIAEELEASGFELDGDVYDGESAEPEAQLPYVADLGDGRLVVAAELAEAEAAVAGDTVAGEAAALLDELESPQRQAVAIEDEGACVTAFALGGEPGGSEVELVFAVDGEAEADRVASELDTGEAPTELGEPEVADGVVHLTATPPEGEADVASLFSGGALVADELYDCA